MKGKDQRDGEKESGDNRSPDTPDPVKAECAKPSIPKTASASDVKTEDSAVHEGIGQDQATQSQTLAELGKVERINIRLATGVFLTGVVGAVLISLQLCEMKRANESTRTLVDAAKIQADSAKTQADLARNAADESKRLNEETAHRAERATNATENAARSMAVQADASSKSANSGEKLASATERTARIAQDALRPVIGFRHDTNVLDKELRFTLFIQNRGARATKFVFNYCPLIGTEPNPSHTIEDCKVAGKVLSVPGLVLPGVDYPIGIQLEERVEDIRQRKGYLFIIGTIDYDDFGVKRGVPVCLVYREQFKGLGDCYDLARPENRNPK